MASHDTARPVAGRPRPPVRGGHRLRRLDAVVTWSPRRRRWSRCWPRWGSPRAPKSARRGPVAPRPRATGRAPLPPTIVGRAGAEHVVLGARHPRRPGRACGSDSRTARSAPGCASSTTTRPPFDLDGRLVGEATFELPADLPLGLPPAAPAGPVASETSTPLIVTPAWLGLPARLGARPHVGAGHPALQRPLRELLGHRRSDRPHRSGGVVGAPHTAPASCWSTRCTRPHRPRRWNRRPTCRPRGASSIRCTCGSRRSPSSPTLRQRGPRAQGARRTSQARAAQARRHRPRHRVDGQARRAASWSTGCQRSAGRELAYAAFRAREGRSLDDFADLVRAGREVRQRLARVAGRSCSTRPARRSPPSPPSTPTQSTSTAGCSGSSTTS